MSENTTATQPTLADLTAVLRAAIESGEGVAEALAAVEGYTPPAPAAKRTPTDVKRWVAQRITDLVAENRDAIAAGPQDAPFTEDEGKVAVAAAANILGYLPGQNQLVWPAVLGERTGRGRGRQVRADATTEDGSKDSE